MPTAQEKRELLFNVHNSVELPTKEFEEDWWPLISNAWSCNSGPKPTPIGAPLGYIRNYSCRLSKQTTPKSKETTPVNKRRARPVRAACDCQAAIKITHITGTGTSIVERYNDAPAVHTHSLADVDKIKRPAVIKNLIGKEVLKSSNPQETIATIRQLAEDSGLGEAAAFVTRAELNNSRRKQRQNELAPLVGDVCVDDEVQAATEFLSSHGYQHLSFGGAHVGALTGVVPIFRVNSDTNTDNSSSTTAASNRINEPSQGFVFARPQQLAKLATHGWLTLIGSVESTNRYDWKLFTLYVRDRLGCWDSGAHFFLNEVTSSIVAQALRLVRQLAPSWRPRYMLTDRTSTVTAGIETAFPRAAQGTSQQPEDQGQCEILFSTTHTAQIWNRNIIDPQVRRRMAQALHCRTRLGYEYMVKKATSGCGDPTIKQYILDNCVNGMEQWALWARQESPFLLQVVSLSALDDYHREVKRLSPIIYGLVGACQAILEVDDSRMILSLKAPSATYTDNHSSNIYDDIPSALLTHIQHFPYTIQLLLIDEAHAMTTRIAKGKRAPSMRHPRCGCDFFNKYSLPCRHVLHTALFGDAATRSPKEPAFLDDTDWMRLQNLFTNKEVGMDIYRTRRTFEKYAGMERSAEEAGAAEVRRLEMEELVEKLKREYRDLAERGDEKGTEALVEGSNSNNADNAMSMPINIYLVKNK
ncbi:hypothetical protein BGW39_004007 [Mortierella sp. 14UC]|nr:hypothetical protein BGW39_004007 [Mortierella sp. 14UC]